MGRLPRRSFANPFVLTLATLPACVVHSGSSQPPPHTASSEPGYQAPGGAPPTTQPSDQPTTTTTPPATNDPATLPTMVKNPPRPAPVKEPTPTNPPTPTPPVLAPKDPTPTVIANPPPPKVDPATKPPTMTPPKVEPTPPQAKDPTPRPAPTTERHWNITRNGTSCTAMDNDACAMPASKAGEAVSSCNPPRPTAYACPANLADHASMTVVQRVGATACYVDRPAPKCAPNVKCNPPPPTKIACP